ncbi:MAG TPA: alpha/beta hydrolase-fold protein [Gammaproteobacteria bacterium]|nr:alpha/beta hydrolase-fold protein [Gammaproteobacteria bacterium]
MAVKRADWASGRIVTLDVDSKVLADNPLGDPHRRDLLVWLPAQYDQGHGRGLGRRFPVLFDLVGFTGAGKAHTNWKAFEENVPERAARLVAKDKMPPCILVFPDCFTALGGNQYVNSAGVGRYADYLTRELIPLVDREFRTLADRDHRGCFGKSSGGYGAVIHGMKYSRYWGAIGNHSGDAYFDFVYRCDWPNTLDQLAKYRSPRRKPGPVDPLVDLETSEPGQDDGRARRFLEAVWKKAVLSNDEVHCLMNLAMAATYDPDPEAPERLRIPFDLETGELVPERWREWLKHDPINLVGRYAKNLKTLRGIYMDCGWRDQYRIHYGCRILSKRLAEAGIDHVYEEFDGTHSNIDDRMDRSLPFLAKALS